MPKRLNDEITPADIIALRERRGWNQAQLATALNMSQASISKLERGLHPISGPMVPLLRRMMVEIVP